MLVCELQAHKHLKTCIYHLTSMFSFDSIHIEYVSPLNLHVILAMLTIIISSFHPATSTQGFEGCLFRAQFDNQFPIKRIFQDPFPSNIDLIPSGNYYNNHGNYHNITMVPTIISMVIIIKTMVNTIITTFKHH